MVRQYWILLFLLCITLSLSGQQNFTLYQLEDVPQVMNDNPARYPRSNVNIGIPALSYVYNSISNSGFVYQDLIHKRQKDDSLTIDMENMIDQLKEKNYLTFHTKLEILSGSFRIKDHYFSLNITEKVDGAFVYPEDLFRLIWEGNGKTLLGQRANLNGLGFDLSHYRAYGIGYARPFLDDRLKVGITAKYLNGIENVWTEKSSIGLYTGEINYDLALDGGLAVHTSGINEPKDIGEYAFGRNNHGFGMDVGASYQLFQQLKLFTSFSDFGFIRWKYNVTNFTNEEDTFRFRGIHIDNLVDSRNPNVRTKADSVTTLIRDSLANTLKVDIDSNPYTKFLNPKLQIGGTFEFNKKHRVGLLLYSRFLKGHMRPGISLSYAYQPIDWFTATANYSAYNRGYTNLGLGFSLNVGPAQLYMTTDNLLAIFLPHKMRNFHLLGGLNLTFGDQKEPDKKHVPRL